VNANQVFYWRKLYREGQLGSKTDTQLVPVKVANDRSAAAVADDNFIPRSGTLEIKLSKGTLRIFGTVDVMALPCRDRVPGRMIGFRQERGSGSLRE